MLVQDDTTLKDDVTGESEVDERLLADERAQDVEPFSSSHFDVTRQLLI
jgi:hypothetical protein